MSGDPLEYLFSLEHFGIKLDLDNIRAIVDALGHPERAFRSVHVAGTNGKGSVTAMVTASLLAAGYHAARYTSPHLVDLTERFVVNGRAVTERELRDAVTHVREAVVALQTAGTLAVHPTFFEVTTATAFELFRRAGVDVAVCEVGLGGRLDATNVLSPVVTAITSIGRDHEQYLGSTLGAIAAEKAGIIKPGVPVVVGPLEPDAETVIARIADEREAPLVRAAADVIVSDVGINEDGTQSFVLQTSRHDYGRVTLALAGDHQRANAAVAVRVLEVLSDRGTTVPPEAVAGGLADVRWPGRLEQLRLPQGRTLLMDAAHNPDGATTLARHLASRGRHPLVFAAMRDKDIEGILRPLLPVVSRVIVTRASLSRSADPADVVEIARRIDSQVPVTVASTPQAALEAAWTDDAFVVAAGSIFLLGDLMKALDRP